MTLRKTLTVHALPINILALSSDGSLMLSGADDGCLMVWNLKSGEKVQEISCVFNGAVTAICWLDMDKGATIVFVFGCSDGNLQLYQRIEVNTIFNFSSMTIAHKGMVEDLQFDCNFGRVASVRGGTAQVWKLNAGGILESLVTEPPRQDAIARSVHFCDAGASIIVCFCESHKM
ncbi:WD40 repeat-like protein [Laetiporus sulphureus 93-53]|uniref:WD40 repeat-like protein n=1 Tax=Laetiporus sulphureus 93-53 TaxID=1314785 RepID=A0A165DPD6_9APHY|nr:WD40 repeat-like protein [Laetiporus sulphureus 93-53]KZT05326.1 WD40 repeat-like protein [Laetiporus sulphureus 93-53]